MGANFAFYSCLAKEVGVENTENYKRLKYNLELNGFDCNIYQVALSDRNGTQFMSFTKNAGVRNVSLYLGQGNKHIEVEVRTLGNILTKEELHSPGVIKIDVEDAEAKVLYGMREFLKEIRVIY